jgi:hypothetical protein
MDQSPSHVLVGKLMGSNGCESDVKRTDTIVPRSSELEMASSALHVPASNDDLSCVAMRTTNPVLSTRKCDKFC